MANMKQTNSDKFGKITHLKYWWFSGKCDWCNATTGRYALYWRSETGKTIKSFSIEISLIRNVTFDSGECVARTVVVNINEVIRAVLNFLLIFFFTKRFRTHQKAQKAQKSTKSTKT